MLKTHHHRQHQTSTPPRPSPPNNNNTNTIIIINTTKRKHHHDLPPPPPPTASTTNTAKSDTSCFCRLLEFSFVPTLREGEHKARAGSRQRCRQWKAFWQRSVLRVFITKNTSFVPIAILRAITVLYAAAARQGGWKGMERAISHSGIFRRRKVSLPVKAGLCR